MGSYSSRYLDASAIAAFDLSSAALYSDRVSSRSACIACERITVATVTLIGSHLDLALELPLGAREGRHLQLISLRLRCPELPYLRVEVVGLVARVGGLVLGLLAGALGGLVGDQQLFLLRLRE